MTHSEAEQLAKEVLASLRVPADLRHHVLAAARKLVGVEDVDAEMATLLERHRTMPLVAGAIGVVATGVKVQRQTEGMSASERSHFLASMRDVGRAGEPEDTGEVPIMDLE